MSQHRIQTATISLCHGISQPWPCPLYSDIRFIPYALRGDRYSLFDRSFNWSRSCFLVPFTMYCILVCTEIWYLEVVTFVFIQGLPVHDRSSNKVMSLGQDRNPVHSSPMVELGLEVSVFTSSYDSLFGRSIWLGLTFYSITVALTVDHVPQGIQSDRSGRDVVVRGTLKRFRRGQELDLDSETTAGILIIWTYLSFSLFTRGDSFILVFFAPPMVK